MREDVRRAMESARGMIVVALLIGGLVLFLWVAAPGFSGGRAWYEEPLLFVGWAGYVFGLAWMVRIYRSRPDTSRSAWRSRDRVPVPVPAWGRNGHTPASGGNRAVPVAGTMRRDVARAQALGRMMIVQAAVVIPLVVAFIWSVSPGNMGGPLTWYEATLPWIGGAGYLLGLGWMIRIYRSRPETNRADWRYRSER